MVDIDEILLRSRDESLRREENDIVLQPFVYISQIPGKKIRVKLSRALNYWLNVPTKELRLIGEIIEMLHNSSLLVDDIQDSSTLRRGVPVAHAIYGVRRSIKSATYVTFACLEKISQLSHPEAAARVYTEQLLELHRGQGMELYWRDAFKLPTLAEYKLMVVRKTGGLFLLALQLMQLQSTSTKDFTKLTTILGLYFQIRDDFCNLRVKEYADSKSFCEDLSEGKFSFPIIHGMQDSRYKTKLMDILRQRTHDVEVKKYCVSLLEAAGSFEYTANVLDSLDREAREEMNRLGRNPFLEELLDQLLSWKDVGAN